ncbi:MAG: hypothetical protein ACRDD8_15870 [Bacteroidales bacterium]
MLKEINDKDLLDKLLGLVLEYQKMEEHCEKECRVDIYCCSCEHESNKWALDDEIDMVNSELYIRKFPMEDDDEDESND